MLNRPMHASAVHHDRCAVLRADDLVITVARDGGGYELLVEVDTDEGAATVPVSIGIATGESVTWDL